MLYCKKAYLTSRQRVLFFSIHCSFSPYENRKTWQKKISSRKINNLLDVLMYSIAEYFYSFFARRASQNTV